MSNLVNDLAPALKNPVTTFLASEPGDSEATGRLKNALEGLGLGTLMNGVFGAVTAMRQAKQLGTDVAGGIGQGLREGAAEATGQDVRGLWRTQGNMAPASTSGVARQVTDEEIAQQLSQQTTATTVHLSDATASRLSAANDLPPSLTIGTAQREQGQVFQSLEASGAPTPSGQTLHINFAHIQTGDDLQQTILRVGEIMRSETEAQRRGVQTLEETAAKAAKSPYQEVDRILGIGPGTALNAEDALATREVWLAASTRLHTLSQQMAQGDLTVAEDWLKQYVLASNVHVKAQGVQAEAGRALRIFGVDMPSTDRQFLDELAGVMTQTGASTPPGTAQSVGAAAASTQMQAMAAKMAQLATPQQLALLMVQSHQVTRADMFSELWYGALLSSPVTHVANTLDNALRTLWAVPERYFTSVTGHPRDMAENFKAANAYTYGLGGAVREAWEYAGKAWETGVSAFGTSTKAPPMLPRAAVSARNLGLDGTLFEGMADLLGSAARLSGRGLLAADEFAKVLNYRAQLHENVFREVSQHPQPGVSAGQQMAALLQQPNQALVDSASAWAHLQTLSQNLNEPGAAFENMGKFVQKLSEGREDWLPAKIVVPFIKVGFNIVRAGMERTPILGNFSANVNRALMAGGAEGALARSKMALGGLTMGMFGLMAAEGMITGKAPVEPGQRATWERLGMQPYSVFLPGIDRYVSYNRLDFVGLPMGLAADFTTIARESSIDSLTEIAGAGIGAIFNNITSKTWMKGVSQVVQAITTAPGESEQTAGKQGEQYFRQLLGSVVPSGVALVARMVDPYQRDTRGLFDSLLDRIPGMGTDIPPRLDLWGRPRLRPEPMGPDMLSPFMSREYTPDVVDNELYAQGTPARMPPRTVNIQRSERVAGEPVELTPQQLHRYIELSAGLHGGQTPLKEALRSVMQSPAYTNDALSDGPRGGKSTLLLDVIHQYQTAGLAQLRAEDPSIERLLERRDIAKALGQTRQGQAQLKTMNFSVGGNAP